MKAYIFNPDPNLHTENLEAIVKSLTELGGLVEIKLVAKEGEFWGGFTPPNRIPGRDPTLSRYSGAEYIQFFVYTPNTHTVNSMNEEAIEMLEASE